MVKLLGFEDTGVRTNSSPVELCRGIMCLDHWPRAHSMWGKLFGSGASPFSLRLYQNSPNMSLENNNLRNQNVLFILYWAMLADWERVLFSQPRPPIFRNLVKLFQQKDLKRNRETNFPAWQFRSQIKTLFTLLLLALEETRRERPKSAPYLRLKIIQGTTIGKIWKKLFFFQKNYFWIFFRKKYFLSRTMPKNSKRVHSDSFNVFYKPKTSKKCKGVPFEKFRKFSKKKSHSAEKNPKGGTLWSHLYFWKH